MIRLRFGSKPVIKIRVSSLVLHAALIIGALVMLFPVAWMFVSAFKPVSEIAAYPPTFLPKQPTLATLRYAWTTINLSLLREQLHRRSFRRSTECADERMGRLCVGQV